jgi:hypothetical protein
MDATKKPPPIIQATTTPEIHNREDFFRILASTTREIDDFAAREPAYPIWGVLQRQLHAMRAWTENGADPTPEQRNRVSIGLVAARELEPAPDAAMEDLVTRLHLLNYYWRHWPSLETRPNVRPRQRENDTLKSDTGRTTSKLFYPTLNISIPAIVSLVLFAVACCLPALEFRNSNGTNDVMFGARALAVGWSGIFAGVFAWYANPCWLLSLFLCLFRRPLPAALVAIAAIALAASTFAVVGRELPGDEGNVTRTTVIRLLPGCYVWMASKSLLPFVAFFRNPR